MTHKFGIAQPFSWTEEEKVGVFRIYFGEMKITQIVFLAYGLER